MTLKFRGSIRDLQSRLRPLNMECKINLNNDLTARFTTQGLNINFYKTGSIVIQGSNDFLRVKAHSLIFGKQKNSKASFDYPLTNQNDPYDYQDILAHDNESLNNDSKLKEELLNSLEKFIRKIVRDELNKSIV